MPHLSPKSNLPLSTTQATPQSPFKFAPLLGKTASPQPETIMPQDRLQFGNLGSASPSVNIEELPRFVNHTVKRGETLGKIAKEHLGNFNLYTDIFDANKDQLRNPNDLRIGMTIKIPVPVGIELPLGVPVEPTPTASTPDQRPVARQDQTDQAPATSPQFSEQKVRRGDSLSILALRHLGDSERYMEIFEANRDQLKNPDALRAGMTLKIPMGANASAGSGAQRADRTGTTHSVSATDGRGLTAGAQELLGAMQHYKGIHPRNLDRSITSPAEMREIAIELDAASKAFGVDPKMMLALYAHESGGINPDARSHTGAGGLGQLTGIAIRQVHYLAGMARGQRGKSPYTQYKSNFVQSTRSINQRYNIKANVWTSVAYMSYELNDRARLGRGVEKALKRYGDPNVSTYANKVNKEHRTLFGSNIF